MSTINGTGEPPKGILVETPKMAVGTVEDRKRAVNDSTKKPLSPRQEAAALALAAGSTVEDAASKAGIGVNRVWVWKREQPLFNQRVRELRAAVTSAAVGLVTEAMAESVRTLDGLQRSSESESVRLRAADALLNHGTAMTAIEDIQNRLSRLEEARR